MNYDNYHWTPNEESLEGFIKDCGMVGNKIAFMHQEKGEQDEIVYNVIFEINDNSPNS